MHKTRVYDFFGTPVRGTLHKFEPLVAGCVISTTMLQASSGLGEGHASPDAAAGSLRRSSFAASIAQSPALTESELRFLFNFNDKGRKGYLEKEELASILDRVRVSRSSCLAPVPAETRPYTRILAATCRRLGLLSARPPRDAENTLGSVQGPVQ